MHYYPINPATGLPMTNESIGGVDVGGNPYGLGHYQNPWSSSMPWGSSFGDVDWL